jgi:nitroreductase
MDALSALSTRTSPVELGEPAPDDAAVETMLAAAVAAPDHGRLKPWRFIAVRGAALARLGEVMATALRAREPDAPEAAIAKERQKPLRAPLILVAAARPIASPKIPAVEQIVAVGAAAQNILLAAHALGFGAMWRTGAPAYDPAVKTALGLAATDEIVGFLYLGTARKTPAIVGREAPRASFVEWSGPTG